MYDHAAQAIYCSSAKILNLKQIYLNFGRFSLVLKIHQNFNRFGFSVVFDPPNLIYLNLGGTDGLGI